jgi:hypothetical protein
MVAPTSLIISSGIVIAAEMSVVPVFATAICLRLLRPNGNSRIWPSIVAWIVAIPVFAISMIAVGVFVYQVFRPDVHSFPEDYIGVAGALCTHTPLVILIVRAQMNFLRSRQQICRGFSVIVLQ